MNTADLKLYTRFFTDNHPTLFAASNIEIEMDNHALRPIVFLTAKNTATGKAVRYAIVEKHMKQVKKDMAVGNYNFLQAQSEFAKQSYSYRGVQIESMYKNVVSLIPVIAPLKNYNGGDPSYSSLLNGDFDRVDRVLENYSKKQAGLLVQIVDVIRQWGSATTIVKDHDLYFSFLEEDHKIDFCLDKAAAISPNGVDVDRTPINAEIEGWFDEAEREAFITPLKNLVGEMNKNTETFFSFDVKNADLEKFRNDLWDTTFAMPIQYQVSKVYEFKDDSDVTKAMVSKEVNKIFELLEQKTAEMGTQVYLDTTAVLPFYKDDFGVSHIISGEDDFIRPIWGTYIESFGKAVARLLVSSDSVYFKPFVAAKDIVDPASDAPAEGTLVVNDPHVASVDERFDDGIEF